MTPQERAIEVLKEARLASYITREDFGLSLVFRKNEEAAQVALDALTAAGLDVVPAPPEPEADGKEGSRG